MGRVLGQVAVGGGFWDAALRPGEVGRRGRALQAGGRGWYGCGDI